MCGTAGISMFSSIPQKGLLGKHRAWLCAPHRSFTGFFAFTNFPLHPLTFVEATRAQLRNYTANQRQVSPSLRFNALKARQQWTNTLQTRVKWRFICKIPMSLGDFAALHVSNWDSKIGQIFAAVPNWLWPLVQHNESAARKIEKKQQRADRTARYKTPRNMKQDEKQKQSGSSFFCCDSVDYILRSRSSQTVSDLATSLMSTWVW